jgi:hypothetical protein
MQYRMIVVTALLVSLASVVSAGGSSLTDSYNRRANAQWDYGYGAMFNPARGELRDGSSITWTVPLRAGTEYKLFGACDEDCGDVDLELYDENGYLVDEDAAGDDYPIVIVRPRYSQTYSFKVTMADCAYSPCGYMVGIFGRQVF